MENVDWKYFLETLLASWDPNTPVPFQGIEYENIILDRLKKDLEDTEESARGFNYTSILRNWENFSNNNEFNSEWKLGFSETQTHKIVLENSELAQLISKLFWSKEYQNLGYAAEAIFLKLISTMSNTSGCFHRLPTFGRFDLYESKTRTFIDIKHSLKEYYEVRFYQLKSRAQFSFRANHFVPEKKYKFAYLPMRIVEVNNSEITFQLRPLKSLEEVLQTLSLKTLKSAI